MTIDTGKYALGWCAAVATASLSLAVLPPPSVQMRVGFVVLAFLSTIASAISVAPTPIVQCIETKCPSEIVKCHSDAMCQAGITCISKCTGSGAEACVKACAEGGFDAAMLAIVACAELAGCVQVQ